MAMKTLWDDSTPCWPGKYAEACTFFVLFFLDSAERKMGILYSRLEKTAKSDDFPRLLSDLQDLTITSQKK